MFLSWRRQAQPCPARDHSLVAATRGPRAYKVFLTALERDYSWLAEVIQTKQQVDITDYNETSHLNDILLKGGVPHPPSFNISRVNEVRKQGQEVP